MVTLEQAKTLESGVSKALAYVDRVTQENALLKGQLEKDKSRIDELEQLVEQFKIEQGKIEERIVATLEQLSHFEANHNDEAPGPDQDPPEAVAPEPLVEVAEEPAPVEEVVPEEAAPEPEPAVEPPADDVAPQAEQNPESELDIF
jgi:hypothetical protein